MKQKPNSNNCVAVVAAMAFNTTVEEFEKYCGTCPSQNYSDMDFIRFGWHKGCFVGLVFTNPGVSDSETVLVEELKIKGTRAYVVVESHYDSSQTHAVYWNGEQIFDPHPDFEDGRELSKYKILAWYPIIDLNK